MFNIKFLKCKKRTKLSEDNITLFRSRLRLISTYVTLFLSRPCTIALQNLHPAVPRIVVAKLYSTLGLRGQRALASKPGSSLHVK